MPYHIFERGGGAEVQAWLLAKELAHRGYEIHYVCQSIVQNKVGTVDIVENVKIHWLPNSARIQWLDAGKYSQELCKIDPDIIVQRMTSCITGTIGRYCKKNRKIFIWMCTDNRAPNRWIFIQNQIEIYQTQKISFLKKCVFLINAFINDLMRHYGMKLVTYAFTQNDIQYKNLLNNFGMESNRMLSGHQMPNKIEPINKKLNEPIVLWAANLGAHKQPELFIKLALLLKNQGIRLIMIGGHSDRKRVNDLFHTKPINLEWMNKLDFDKTLSWFDKALVFVNTSKIDREGFPNTFIQAWLRGIPVLSLGVDPDEVIKNNKLGFVCSSVEEMRTKIERLISDRTLYASLSDNVYRYANSHHSLTQMTDNFLYTIRNERD